MDKYSQQLAKFIAGLRYEDLPPKTVEAAKEKLIDYIAVSVAGVRTGTLFSLMLPWLQRRGEKAVSHVVATKNKFGASTAALLNGVASHAIDLDDGHREALGHPGVCVWSAVLAEAEARNLGGRDAISAAVAGYDVFVRVGRALNPGIITRGFHTTGVCGSLAAASAVGKLLSLDESKMASALGIAGLFSSGLMIVTLQGQMMKPMNAGRAAESGVMAAELAELGADGAKEILESRDGFAQAFSGQTFSENDFESLGRQYKVGECYIKYYPACRHAHAAIDAAFVLRKKVDLRKIDNIVIHAYPNALQLTLKHNLPEDDAATRFNLAFAVALALVTGRADEESFSMESVKNPMIQSLFGKTKIISDPSLDNREKNIRGIVVEITTDSGERITETVLLPRGEPENPGTEEDIRRKFDGCIGNFWNDEKKNRVFSAALELENWNIGEFLTLME